MIESNKPNPFQVLGLPTNATMKQVVERGQEVDEDAKTEEERQLCRWAVEQLRTNPHTRLEYELFELPAHAMKIEHGTTSPGNTSQIL